MYQKEISQYPKQAKDACVLTDLKYIEIRTQPIVPMTFWLTASPTRNVRNVTRPFSVGTTYKPWDEHLNARHWKNVIRGIVKSKHCLIRNRQSQKALRFLIGKERLRLSTCVNFTELEQQQIVENKLKNQMFPTEPRTELPSNPTRYVYNSSALSQNKTTLEA